MNSTIFTQPSFWRFASKIINFEPHWMLETLCSSLVSCFFVALRMTFSSWISCFLGSRFLRFSIMFSSKLFTRVFNCLALCISVSDIGVGCWRCPVFSKQNSFLIIFFALLAALPSRQLGHVSGVFCL